MAKLFAVPIDMGNNEIRNVLFQLLASDPASPTEGQFWYNTTTHRPKARLNGSTLDLSDALTLGGSTLASVLSRANHTGTQLASTISDFDTQVRTSRLDQLAAPTADLSINSHKLTNVTDPSSGQDAATKAYVDAQVAGARDIKDSVRVATAAALPAYSRVSNVITASANGALAAVDGVTLVANDRLLLKDGAAGADNGIYSVTQVGTGGTPFILTRTSDADASAEVTAGLYVWVEEGTTNADTGWLLTTNNPITLNTTALTFTQVSALGQITAGAGLTKTGSTLDMVAGSTPGSGGPGGGLIINANDSVVDKDVVARHFAASVGDGAATSIDVTHNLGTKDVVVSVWDNTTPFAEIVCDVEHKTTNVVTVKFSVAPTNNQFRVVVIG